MIPKRPLLLAIGTALALAGCTSTAATTAPSVGSPSPTTATTVIVTPTVTATPTPSLDADQAAALDVVMRYTAVMAKVRSDPPKYGQYKMIELLKPLAFDDMIQANLNGMQPWRDNGWHAEGSVETIGWSVSNPIEVADGTTQVRVTLCRDQRGLRVLDKKGKRVTDKVAQFPDFLQNTYDLRKPVGAKAFRLWELGGESVERCQP